MAPALSARADAAADNDERARIAFEEGRIAYDRADFQSALQHFETAHALSGRPALLYNIARAADSEGLFEKAAAAYSAYLEAVPEAENREFARGRLVKLKERLATQPPAPPPAAPLQVGLLTVDARPPATALSIDGVPVAASTQPLQLSPGAHEIVVGTPGYEAQSRRVTMRAGEAQTVTILFTRLAATTPTTAAPERKRSLVRNPWLWTAVGVVVAGAAAGTAVGLHRDSGTKLDVGTSGALGKTP